MSILSEQNEPYVLVYGGNGWIGSKVYNLLVTMGIKVKKSDYRADDFNNVEINLLNSRLQSKGISYRLNN